MNDTTQYQAALFSIALALISYLGKRCVNRIDRDLLSLEQDARNSRDELKTELAAIKIDLDSRVDTVEKDIKKLGAELSKIMREEIKSLRDEMNTGKDTTTHRLDTIVQMLANRNL